MVLAFAAVAEVGCFHHPVVERRRHPHELPGIPLIEHGAQQLGNQLSGSFHALRFEKSAESLLGDLHATASIGGSIWRT